MFIVICYLVWYKLFRYKKNRQFPLDPRKAGMSSNYYSSSWLLHRWFHYFGIDEELDKDYYTARLILYLHRIFHNSSYTCSKPKHLTEKQWIYDDMNFKLQNSQFEHKSILIIVDKFQSTFASNAGIHKDVFSIVVPHVTDSTATVITPTHIQRYP